MHLPEAAFKDLTHFRQVTRDAAATELFKHGDPVLPLIRKAAEATEGDAKISLNAFVQRWELVTGNDRVRLRRCVKILLTFDSKEAKGLARKIESDLP